MVGVARATSDAYPDPKDKSGKLSVVDVAPVQALKRPVTLAEIKASKAFTTFPLTRLPRLSVMPVTDAEWKEIEKMSQRLSRLPSAICELALPAKYPFPAPLRPFEHVLPLRILPLVPQRPADVIEHRQVLVRAFEVA